MPKRAVNSMAWEVLIVGLMIGVLGLCLIASAVIGHVEVVAVGALLIVNLALLDLCRSL